MTCSSSITTSSTRASYEDTIYITDAVCCDLLCDVADFALSAIVDHRTISSKTNTAKYHKDSGVTGGSSTLKTTFQTVIVYFFSPRIVFAKIKIRFFVLHSMVGADTAAAITITCRGTYAFDTYMSNAGIDWVPKKIQVFEPGIQSDALSIFPFSLLFVMVERQITNHIKQKLA